MTQKRLKKWVQRYKFGWWARNILRGANPAHRCRAIADDSETLDTADIVDIEWPDYIRKPSLGIVLDASKQPYWTKFRRLALNNRLPFSMIDIHRSDWMDSVRDHDLIVWHPSSSPSDLEEARRKVYLLERHLGIPCYPSIDTLLLYEDKIMQSEQFRLYGIPAVRTLCSCSYEEAMQFANGAEYPLVCKLATGSASAGVEIVPTKKRARKIINEAFSERGRWTYWPYLRHQGYVYLQEYVENAGYDLRIVVIGDMVFGYYRYPPKGDFRASGLGEVRKHDLPEEAMCLAVSVVSRLNLIMGAVDMLYSSCERRYVVIEVSAFIRVDTPEQLIVGETPGVYLHREGTFSFRPGRYWIQEIALREFLTRTWIAPRLDDGTHGTV